MIAPSLCPGRAGAVTFPMTIDVTGMSDWAIIVQPDIHQPLMITHPAAIGPSSDSISGSADRFPGEAVAVINADRGCAIEPIEYETYHCIPLTTSGGTLQAVFAYNEGDAPMIVATLMFYNTAAGGWVLSGASANVLKGTSATMAGVAIPATVTHVAWLMTNSSGNQTSGSAHGTYTLNPLAGTTFTCAQVVTQSVMDVFYPEWEKVLEVADRVSIPFMDCLVTYQGSSLNNQGSIAVCGCSEELIPDDGDYYPMIAARPFDSYDGRLASQGETDGGGHWHLLHDDLHAYSLREPQNQITGPRGYFGIKGMDSSQTVRVKVKLVLNYYTVDPAFSMSFQQPWGETDILLYTLRTMVPLVSSNDSHLEKLYRLAKRKALEAGRWALKNPEEAAAMAVTAGQVFI